MRRLWDVADLVRRMRRELRFGEFSRAPLNLFRIELQSNTLECDWTIRAADIWDSSLRPAAREHNESQQVLLDAIAIRALAFDALPEIDSAVLRGFRQPAREPPEIVVLGTVSREVPDMYRVSSLAMRAKLLGFCFMLEEGSLRPLQLVEKREEFIS